MSGAIVETDRAGTLVGSSYVHATARDWARFGQLFLDNGVRDGTRILPKGWVVEATTPAAASPNGCYGFQLWLNRGSASGVRPRPSLPADLILLNGSFGQFLAVVPGARVIVVSLGETHDWNIDVDPDPLIAPLIGAVCPGQHYASAESHRSPRPDAALRRPKG